MKSKYLILLLFLLIPFIAKSQDGLTKGKKKYWFTESQVQEMYRVKYDLEFAELENITLQQMISVQDSIVKKHERQNLILNTKIGKLESQYQNQIDITTQWEQKYRISENTINSLKNVKTALIVTTSVVAVATVIAIIK